MRTSEADPDPDSEQDSDIHLCIVQPAGYLHALGFLDQARFFRYQFRRLGARVTIGQNRLRHDAINFVFGAHLMSGNHLMFDASATQRFRCVFVNLEQLGRVGARVPDAFLELLATSPVVDYDAENISAYRGQGDGKDGEDVFLVSFAHAPYLACAPSENIALDKRPLDVLFFGSINDRRRAMLKEITTAGHQVHILPFGLYGPERDDEILRAKVVFNCHFYDSARFEQARVFQCLSLGTPVISERTAMTNVPPQFEHSVFWTPSDGVRAFFDNDFRRADFFDLARQKLARFATCDVLDQYATVLARVQHYFAARPGNANAAARWQPERIHIGSGRDYWPGWLNVDVLESAQPDVLLDLSLPLELPARMDSATLGPLELRPESIQFIYASNVLEHVRDLPRMMTNCLRLLKTGGQMLVEVPNEGSPGAWQDPTHVRAFNENSWLYYTTWFWYLGWFDERFDMVALEWLDHAHAPCKREQAHFMRVRLQKIRTSALERSMARALRPDFGGLPDDALTGR